MQSLEHGSDSLLCHQRSHEQFGSLDALCIVDSYSSALDEVEEYVHAAKKGL